MGRRALYEAISCEVGWHFHTAKTRTLDEVKAAYRAASKYADMKAARPCIQGDNMTDKLSDRELTATLKALAQAHSRAAVARDKIARHAEAVYGVDPADVDCEAFIDACDGGCGRSSGMTAAEFDAAMQEALSRAGIAIGP